MTPEISAFDPWSASDADLAGYYDLNCAVMALDHPEQSKPTLQENIKLLRQPAGTMGPMNRWVGREDGRIVGAVSVTRPEHENLHVAIVRVAVVPERRRRGIGTALLRAVLPELSADGRTVVMGSGVKADASGELWAKELGFVRTLAYVRQRLRLAEADPALWQRPVAEGFRLERWTGAAPEALLAQYARARTAILDAPNGESALDFEDWTPERVRAHEADLRALGVTNRVVVAVHEATGQVAALTEFGVRAARPSWGSQMDTAVMAGFRGHGLGLAVKGAMLQWLVGDQTGVEEIYTQTAHDNTHMIRINHTLGYVTTTTTAELEVGTAELAERLEA